MWISIPVSVSSWEQTNRFHIYTDIKANRFLFNYSNYSYNTVPLNEEKVRSEL